MLRPSKLLLLKLSVVICVGIQVNCSDNRANKFLFDLYSLDSFSLDSASLFNLGSDVLCESYV